MPEKRLKGLVLFAITATLCLALAQISSFLVESHLTQGQSVKVFDSLYLTHIRNMGGIFGIMQGKGWFFTIMSMLVLIALFAYVWFMRASYTGEYFFYGMVVGGGLSNIADRLVYGSVIDFVDVRGISFWNYIFNTADVLIHLGIWPLVILSLIESRKPQPLEYHTLKN